MVSSKERVKQNLHKGQAHENQIHKILSRQLWASEYLIQPSYNISTSLKIRLDFFIKPNIIIEAKNTDNTDLLHTAVAQTVKKGYLILINKFQGLDKVSIIFVSNLPQSQIDKYMASEKYKKAVDIPGKFTISIIAINKLESWIIKYRKGYLYYLSWLNTILQSVLLISYTAIYNNKQTKGRLITNNPFKVC